MLEKSRDISGYKLHLKWVEIANGIGCGIDHESRSLGLHPTCALRQTVWTFTATHWRYKNNVNGWFRILCAPSRPARMSSTSYAWYGFTMRFFYEGPKPISGRPWPTIYSWPWGRHIYYPPFNSVELTVPLVE